MKKKIIIIIVCLSAFAYKISTQAEQPSWIYKKYSDNVLWPMKQLSAMYNKLSTAQKVEQKWGKRFEEQGLKSLDLAFAGDPKADAALFKKALVEAARNDAKNPSSQFTKKIMSRFLNKPEQFLFGASSSSYQYEGGLDEFNANASFYEDKGLRKAGKAIDFWNRYASDIKQMKEELGINCFRISIAWDRVEPLQGQYDTKAIETYVKIIKMLKDFGIEPIIVLHHYTIPRWFEEVGGFEKEENIQHFVTFAEKMCNALHPYVTYWSTFNAIEGYAFKGYVTLDGPPGKKPKSFYKSQLVMANMLNAHTKIYHKIKVIYNLQYGKPNNAQVGIQKNIVILDPQAKASILIRTPSTVTSVIGEGLQNKGFFDYFTTGIFDVNVPEVNLYGRKNVYYKNENGPHSIDWIGLNFYSNMEMRFGTKLEETDDDDRKTANINYRDYPEGIYRAIKIIFDRIAKPLNIPIIITENGIATLAKELTSQPPDYDDLKRTRFFKRVLYIIRKLIEKGYPIIGYTPWASHDNYEWPNEKQPNPFISRRYGFFHVNFNIYSPDYLKRTLKVGAHYYRDFIKAFFEPGNNEFGVQLLDTSNSRLKLEDPNELFPEITNQSSKE